MVTGESANFNALLLRLAKSMDGLTYRDSHVPGEETVEEVRGLLTDAGLTRHLAIYAEILAIDPRKDLDPRASLVECEAFIARRELDILDIDAQLDRAGKSEFTERDEDWVKMARRARTYKRNDLVTALRIRLHLMRDIGMQPEAPSGWIEAESNSEEGARLLAENRKLRDRARKAEAALEVERNTRLRQIDRNTSYTVAMRRKLQQVAPGIVDEITAAAEAVQKSFDEGQGTVVQCLETFGLGRLEFAA
ncbi:hypothetical protein ACEUZ9_001065 [Paracoccus litorisediminis]|uniref:hypothetical protein n=1 Tax=Paracoccus litorisediminis TaxID=2006130 RepID=UPI00372DBA23